MTTFRTDTFLGNTTNQIDEANYKVSVVQYTQKVSEEWHWHDRFHVSTILRGGNLESRQKEEIQVIPGRIMTYEIGEVHRNRYTAHPSTNLNIELSNAFFRDDLSFEAFDGDTSSYFSLLQVYFELSLNDSYSTSSISQTLETLFWKDSKKHNHDWIPRLEVILKDRWNEFVPLEELAAALDIHPITISKYFAKYKGYTLADYMRRLKVNRASNLLMESKGSLAEIAYRCGFSDQSHMTRVMRRYLGHTPHAIRASHRR